jgi:hypothetical protein
MMKVYIVNHKGAVITVCGTKEKAMEFLKEMEEYGNFGTITEYEVN